MADSSGTEETKNIESSQETSTTEEPDVGVETNPPPPPDVVELCRETFKKTAEYMKGELEGTIEDYKLLETMNKVTVSKYSEMKNSATEIGTSLQELNEKYKNLQPFLDQIDQIEDSVSTLEQAAYKLDAYSKRLEAKFKALEKR
ncbi:biogenesis of lysosome-related organelles complex 1 subunit 2 [Mactra antiquata]